MASHVFNNPSTHSSLSLSLSLSTPTPTSEIIAHSVLAVDPARMSSRLAMYTHTEQMLFG